MSANLFDLVRIFALPLYEQVDASGRHSFARFLAGLERSGMMMVRALLLADFPETERLIARMAELLPDDLSLGVQQRLRLATGLIVAALQVMDWEAEPGSAEAQALFENSVAMAAAAMAAPLPNI